MKYFLIFLLLATLSLDAETHYNRGIKQYKAKEYSSALKSFYVSARHFNVKSYYMLGKMHEEGIGTGNNLYIAFYWYKKSAQRGDNIAQYRLGYLYETGKGVTKNLTKSKRWYLQAYRNGNDDAKIRLEKSSANKSNIDKSQKLSVQKEKIVQKSNSANLLSALLTEDDY